MCAQNLRINKDKSLLNEIRALRKDADICLEKINAAKNKEEMDKFLPEFIAINERGERLLIEGKKWEAAHNNRKARRMAGSNKIIKMHLLLKAHAQKKLDSPIVFEEKLGE